MQITIYTDTTANGPRRQESEAGAVVEVETSKGPATKTIFRSTHGCETASWAEIAADALDQIKPGYDAVVYTGSQFLFYTMNSDQLDRWAENGWKTVKGTELKYRDIWQRLYEHQNSRGALVFLMGEHSYSKWLRNEIAKRGKD